MTSLDLRFVLLAFALAGCQATTPVPGPGDPAPRRGDEISVCGQLFHTGAKVVLWNDPGGYDAYRLEPRFKAEEDAEPQRVPRRRYHSHRAGLPPEVSERVRRDGWTLPDLQLLVDQFVIHYDVAGTSRQCFKVLQDVRNLSVHFMLDVDGTIYQTLDLKERAWHATIANDRSVGIEIAHPGAYGKPDDDAFKTWYARDAEGVRAAFPAWMKETGIRTPGFVARPARPDLVVGTIQGRKLWQYDFTDAQYAALAQLAATLSRVFPRMPLTVPRGDDGSVVPRALTAEEFAAHHGLLGHWHVTTNKTDPGPAFDWTRLLHSAGALAPDRLPIRADGR